MTDEKTTNTILVVDDVADNISVIDGMLRPLYRVRAALGGEVALDALRRAPVPDLVLLDVRMPGMDGYAVLRAMQADAELATIPVVFVTALDSDEEVERGLREGAVDYVAKPVSAEVLRARIRTHIELSHARARLRRENHDLEAAVLARTRENDLIQDVMLRALASLSDARDSETGLHVHRTERYVRALTSWCVSSEAIEPRISRQLAELIVRAAPLHDIGKVGIADAILRKPGRLTPEEFEVMKQHSAIGARAIEVAISHVPSATDVNGELLPAFSFLTVARELIRHHHERWDGSGYPDGLAGTQIPVGARIMALADVFDALISDRPYKRAMSFREAADIIEQGRGTHFDPAVVDAFRGQSRVFEELAHELAAAGP